MQVIDGAERLAALEDLEYARARIGKLQTVLVSSPDEAELPPGGEDMARIAVESLADRFPGAARSLGLTLKGMRGGKGEEGVKSAVSGVVEALKAVEREGMCEVRECLQRDAARSSLSPLRPLRICWGCC